MGTEGWCSFRLLHESQTTFAKVISHAASAYGQKLVDSSTCIRAVLRIILCMPRVSWQSAWS
jgi:hypothetical protein